MWNSHRIRPSKNDQIPSGRPIVMYYAPHLWGSTDQLHLVTTRDIDFCSSLAQFRSTTPCDKDVYDISMDIIIRDNLQLPTDSYSAVGLYVYLRREILMLL